MSPFSDGIVFSVHTRKQRFQKAFPNIASLWRAFLNGSVFGDRFRRCSEDDSRIRSKTAVTGPERHSRRYLHAGMQASEENNKHLMTGHKGNSEFCFPEKLNVPRGEAEGNIEVEGKQNLLFPEGSVIKCFVIPSDSKIEKAPKKIICLRPLHTKLSGCQNQLVLSKCHDNSLFLRS